MTDPTQAPFIAKRWIILLVLFLARTVMAYQFQTVGALGLILVDALKIDFVWLGTLIGLYMLPGAVFSLPGGPPRTALRREKCSPRRTSIDGGWGRTDGDCLISDCGGRPTD
jgi:hypothetical protein